MSDSPVRAWRSHSRPRRGSIIITKASQWGTVQFRDAAGVLWRVFDYRVDPPTCHKTRVPLGDARAEYRAFLREKGGKLFLLRHGDDATRLASADDLERQLTAARAADESLT
jgi:hypothetical protein